ncbi:GNAT family N-acetyltransferase [Corallococcus llansteffanensis]|uniref:N-acetyltransferase n=1 Tax=Corallococcus llansteffanensis TaxID=2316731 RepID=A0A3A8QB15_9BACT|nr:GNAT family N-acetyltransferase [Corallococcus llansteffanensis]RKH65786.1 N-acetyltransferase [Corallococcus llansteffanensis]
MITLGPTLETPRLILRPPTLEDLDGFAAMMADPESAQFIGGLQPRSNVWRAVCAMAGSWVLQGYAMFSVFEKSTGKWVGRVGPWKPDGWPGTEVGWGLLREHWGKGYASESSAATIDWAFDHLGWTEVIHSIIPENTPSKQVAQRLGSRFLRMDYLPAPYEKDPMEIWGQSREEWRTRKK